VLGLLAGLGIGLAAGTLWTQRAPGTHPDQNNSQSTGDSQGLSDGTKAILSHLHAPAELKLYSTLDPATSPPELRGFARRVDQLLSLYEQASSGKIKVTHLPSIAYTNASAAVNLGIKPFTLNNGDECLIGLSVLYQGHRETVPQLVPEWEPALEIDISRAIQNAINSAPASSAPPVIAGNAKQTTEELKRLLPNLDSVSLADGTRILRDAALKEFGDAAKDSQAQLKEAQQQLAQAQTGGAEADQQAAVKHLQEVQAGQTERLREIAAKSRAQIDTFRAIKGSGQ